MSDENKSGRLASIFLKILKSPVNTIFALFLGYFAFKVYVLGGGMTDKLIMFGIIALWMFWFIAKHMLLLFMLLLLIGGGAYWYYSFSHQQQTACENSGGEWNAKTKTCEERKGFFADVRKIWQTYSNTEK